MNYPPLGNYHRPNSTVKTDRFVCIIIDDLEITIGNSLFRIKRAEFSGGVPVLTAVLRNRKKRDESTRTALAIKDRFSSDVEVLVAKRFLGGISGTDPGLANASEFNGSSGTSACSTTAETY